jgi:hypothetical protein
MHGWAPEAIEAIRKPETAPAEFLSVFFADSEASRAAGEQAAGRIFGARTADRDAPTSWQTRLAQYDAVCAWASRTTRCSSGSRRSTNACSWPTATATR